MKSLRLTMLAIVSALSLTVLSSSYYNSKLDEELNTESTIEGTDNITSERYSVVAGGTGGSWRHANDSNDTQDAGTTLNYSLPEHNYIGVQVCGRSVCHGSEERGNQLGAWQNSAHARAYEILGSLEAQAIAAERGIENPQQSEECLRCHTTAYDVPDSFLEEGFDRTMGVQCESCHGPGADYKPMRIMRDRELAVANGLIIPDERICLRCHNEESPTFQEFNYQEMLELILHPMPDVLPE